MMGGLGATDASTCVPLNRDSTRSTFLVSLTAMNSNAGEVNARSGASQARMRNSPPRRLGSVHVPSGWVARSVLATEPSTMRSTWTVAPATGPSGPVTVPLSVAWPGPGDTFTTGRPATVPSWAEEKSTSEVVVVLGTSKVGSGPAFTCPAEQAATRATATTPPCSASTERGRSTRSE